MARVIMCDRCGTIIKNYLDSYTIDVTINVSKTNIRGRSRNSETNSYFHLCKICFNDFTKKFMSVKDEESDG